MCRKNTNKCLSFKNNNVYKYLNDNNFTFFHKKLILLCAFINKEARNLKLYIPFEIYNLIKTYYKKQFYETDISNLKELCINGPIEKIECYISAFGPEILFSDSIFKYFRFGTKFKNKETYLLLEKYLAPPSYHYGDMYFYNGKSFINDLAYHIYKNNNTKKKENEPQNENTLSKKIKNYFSYKFNKNKNSENSALNNLHVLV